jgi:adenylate cyclase
MNRQWQDEGLNLNFTTRIGIHAGNAIVGNFGSDDRINYTAIGDSVNIASRLESANKEYSTDIIVSRSVVDAVQAETGSDPLIFDRIDNIRVRGKQQSVEIYSLRGFREPVDLNS